MAGTAFCAGTMRVARTWPCATGASAIAAARAPIVVRASEIE